MSCFLFASCSTPVSVYSENKPALSLENFLNGHIYGSGMIENWRGKVVQRFDFEGDAVWHDGVCVFKEQMRYYDGHIDHRVWTIKKLKEGYYEGTTSDVIGVAKIFVSGNAMNWQYKMDIKVSDSVYRLSFDDWMYLMNNDVLINKNTFKKFGLTVGSLTLVMNKSEYRSKHE